MKVVLKWSCPPQQLLYPFSGNSCWILSRKTLQQRLLGACWNRAFLESIQQLLPLNGLESGWGLTPFQNHLHQSHPLGQICHPEKKMLKVVSNRLSAGETFNFVEILIEQYVLRKISFAHIFRMANLSQKMRLMKMVLKWSCLLTAFEPVQWQ